MAAKTTTASPRYFELLWTLVQRQLLLRSKRAVIGTAWPAIAPLVMLAVYSFVFNRVFDVPIEHYTEYLFAGLLPWSLLSQSVSAAFPSLSNEADLIRRAPFRYELLPMAVVGSMAVYFLVTLAGFVGYLGAVGRLSISLLPVLALPVTALFLFVAGVAMLVALFDVYNRDLRFFQSNLLTVWFFLLPIVYRQEMAPDSVQALRSIDPMNMIIGQFRYVLYSQDVARPTHVVYMLFSSLVFFVVCLLVFRRGSTQLPKDV